MLANSVKLEPLDRFPLGYMVCNPVRFPSCFGMDPVMIFLASLSCMSSVMAANSVGIEPINFVVAKVEMFHVREGTTVCWNRSSELVGAELELFQAGTGYSDGSTRNDIRANRVVMIVPDILSPA